MLLLPRLVPYANAVVAAGRGAAGWGAARLRS